MTGVSPLVGPRSGVIVTGTGGVVDWGQSFGRTLVW